ncbi:MAG: M20/M25/M40 family metallo-hydrolase [Pyrinomonadaceae bacterium]
MNLKRTCAAVFLIYAVILPTVGFAQPASATATIGQGPIYTAPADVIDKIKDEGMHRSQVMETLGYLSDVIGPRLTASPGMKRANDWTRDTLTKWGMSNAHLEPWGPFGRGWTLKKFYAMVDGPTAFPLLAYPKAWSPGTDTLVGKASDGAFTAEVVRFNATTEADLDQYKGKLKGKIVLLGDIRQLKPHFDPDAKRTSDKELLDLADAPDPATVRRPQVPPTTNPLAQAQFNARRFRFLADEGAAIIVDGARGDFGTIFVQQATAVQPPPPEQGQRPAPIVRVWDKGANIPVQVSLAAEHFNRLERMIAAGEHPTMSVDLKVAYQDSDPNGYNTIAEIPGTDKADEIVMLGGHLDSWHSGTGATDNGAGCAVMMEAMRIIKTLGLQPRRTIRLALWTGEEEGLLGSREYVKDHFGWMGVNGARPPMFAVPIAGPVGTGTQTPTLTKGKEYDKLSSYFNIDNGTGRIRGIYTQGNDAVRPVFKSWFEPFRDPHWLDKDHELGAYTLSMANTGGTDHLSYDAIGLPGFQFIQDEIEYSTRTHHSNMDVFDRIQADDMKQISTIVAAFVYQAAMMDGQMPKKARP